MSPSPVPLSCLLSCISMQGNMQYAAAVALCGVIEGSVEEIDAQVNDTLKAIGRLLLVCVHVYILCGKVCTCFLVFDMEMSVCVWIFSCAKCFCVHVSVYACVVTVVCVFTRSSSGVVFRLCLRYHLLFHQSFLPLCTHVTGVVRTRLLCTLASSSTTPSCTGPFTFSAASESSRTHPRGWRPMSGGDGTQFHQVQNHPREQDY